MKPLAALATIIGLAMSASVSAQQPPAKPKELDILSEYVGNWTSDVTNKPAVWDQKGTKFDTLNEAEWILDGWFLQNIEVNHVVGDPEKVTKSLFLWTYDPRFEKYVAWAFQSTGNVAASAGKWDATSKTFVLDFTDPPPKTTGKMTEQFLDEGTIKGNLTFIGDDGKTLMDMVWTRNRQAGVAGKPTREQWDEIGTPISPLPSELKKLQPFVGEWDCAFTIAGPSVGVQSAKGKMSVKWILDGHFLFITTEQGSNRSILIIGFDSNKDRYRQFAFTNIGQIDERIGDWNGEFETIDWTVANERPGSMQITQYYIGIDPVALGQGKEVLQICKSTHDAEGKFQQSVTINATRRK